MLALGKSKPWPEALQQYLGTDTITTEPIKEYFQPLIEWLQQYRSEHNYAVGWDEDISLSSSGAPKVFCGGIHVWLALMVTALVYLW